MEVRLIAIPFQIRRLIGKQIPLPMNAASISPRTDCILPLRAKETILVVDDQPALCEVAEILLTRCGYHVVTAHDPLQAKIIALQNPNIDLLLTDVEMPNMRGDELAEWFLAVNPRATVVFMSGNPTHHHRLEGRPFIEKPFVYLDVFVRSIRAALAQNRAVREVPHQVAA